MRAILAGFAASAAVFGSAGLAVAETWTFDRDWRFPIVAGDQPGLYRTQGIVWNADRGEWLFSWQYGLERADEAFASLQRTGSLDFATGTLVTGIPQVLADQGFDHIGDIDVHDGVLYASLDSEAGDYQNGHVALFDADDLSYTGQLFELIGAPTNPRDDVASWVAVDGAAGLGYGKEWRNGNTINVYDLDDWSFLDVLVMDESIRNIQGGKIFEGALYMSSHNGEKSVYRLDLATLDVVELFQLPRVDAAFNETEGLALRALPGGGAEMFVEMIVEPDADESEAYLRLFRYVREPHPAPVPVPAALPLLASALAAVALIRRRRG